MMFDKLPNDRQPIEVRVGDEWQPATYQDGQFIDAYGLPLDAVKVSSWRDPNGMASQNRIRANGLGASGAPTPRIAGRAH
jgi:hypothetical protein